MSKYFHMQALYGCSAEKIRHKNLFSPSNKYCLYVSWCFEPGQPQRITSGLNTNLTLSPSHSFHKSSYHKSCFFSLFIFCRHSAWEPASSRVTYSFCRPTQELVLATANKGKKSEVFENLQVNGLEG